MTKWGYTLSSEEFGPADLVRQAERAEDAGFEFLTVSDHYHPWTTTQGESPFVWTTIGGVAARTKAIALGTGVTCPIIRTHPAIIAQAAASSASILGDSRFFLGVGTGEWLNEHILGDRWPAIETRIDMLVEAISVMRALWTGDTVDHRGEHYTVENAKLFTTPGSDIPIIWAASGAKSAQRAAAVADGLWSTSPDAEVVDAYRSAGGGGPIYGQVTLCYGDDRDEAIETAHRVWPNAGIPGQLSQDLPTWTHFEQAAELVSPDHITERVPCGPDVDAIAQLVQQYVDAGFDHVHFHQVGQDQRRFLDAWHDRIRPALHDA